MKMLVGCLVGAALLLVPSAAAKGFGPGDLRLCGAASCRPVMDVAATRALSKLIYTGPARPGSRVPLGARAYELRFDNGYATGIAAGTRLDRFLSYGVVIGRFKRGTWYRVPPTASAELRRLARGLRPVRVTPEAIAKSR